MHPSIRLATAIAIATITAHTIAPAASVRVPVSPVSESARLRAHFDAVDVELRARPVASLTAAQRNHRATLIRWLREYRDAGVFPQNDRFPGTPTPYFRDAHGTLCAMAYLIERSGRGDLVDRVARSANNAFIPELAADSQLQAWLDSTGLTLAEAARIQPSYGGPGDLVLTDGPSGEYLALSLVASGAGLVASGFNVARPTQTSGALGLTAGVIAFFIGSQENNLSREDRSLAKVNQVIGVGSFVLGAYGLIASQSRRGAIGNTRAGLAVGGLHIGPALVPSGDVARLGMGFQARF